MATQKIDHDPARRVDTETFVNWCEEQAEKSRSLTSRIIVNDEEMVKFRLREGEVQDDIVLIKGDGADTLRFVRNGNVRQFHAHRRGFTFHDKTLIVRDGDVDGPEICRAGTGTRNQRGPFPV